MQGSRIQDSGAWVQDTGPWVSIRGSVETGSWIQGLRNYGVCTPLITNSNVINCGLSFSSLTRITSHSRFSYKLNSLVMIRVGGAGAMATNVGERVAAGKGGMARRSSSPPGILEML